MPKFLITIPVLLLVKFDISSCVQGGHPIAETVLYMQPAGAVPIAEFVWVCHRIRSSYFFCTSTVLDFLSLDLSLFVHTVSFLFYSSSSVTSILSFVFIRILFVLETLTLSALHRFDILMQHWAVMFFLSM